MRPFLLVCSKFTKIRLTNCWNTSRRRIRLQIFRRRIGPVHRLPDYPFRVLLNPRFAGKPCCPSLPILTHCPQPRRQNIQQIIIGPEQPVSVSVWVRVAFCPLIRFQLLDFADSKCNTFACDCCSECKKTGDLFGVGLGTVFVLQECTQRKLLCGYRNRNERLNS